MIEQTFAPNGQKIETDPRTVLLVEDDGLVAMVVEENLRDLGFEPITVSNAAGAVAAMAAGLNPIMAVIDVGLPDERGDQLAKRLRGLYPQVPVIIASGYDEHELRSRFCDDPSVAVLAKPYTETDLAYAARTLGLLGIDT